MPFGGFADEVLRMTIVHRPWRLALAGGLLLVAAAAVSPALGANAGVSIVERVFEPATVVVAQGDTVTWTVTKTVGEPHSVTSGKIGDAKAGSVFDSGTAALKDDGQSFPFTFKEAGTFDYFCRFHPVTMFGQVIVLAPGQSAPPGAEPAPGAAETGIPAERRLLGGGILVATLIVLFGAAWLYRRMNPA
jgi:plastocyanin